jgi:RNA polymerase sigma-70 factor, ECF subfamily
VGAKEATLNQSRQLLLDVLFMYRCHSSAVKIFYALLGVESCHLRQIKRAHPRLREKRSPKHAAAEVHLSFVSSVDVRELIRACAESNDSCAWERFVARFERPISLSVMRAAKRWGEAPDEVAADLIQETYLRLCDGRCHLLYNFALNHPEAVDGYVKTVAANIVHDYCKTKRLTKHGAGAVSQIHENFDPVAQSESQGGAQAMERKVLLREIDVSLESSTEGATRERDRTLFWLHYEQGLSATAIAELPTVGLTVKGVESAILRLTRQVRNRIHEARSGSNREQSGTKRGFRTAKSF